MARYEGVKPYTHICLRKCICCFIDQPTSRFTSLALFLILGRICSRANGWYDENSMKTISFCFPSISRARESFGKFLFRCDFCPHSPGK